MHDFSICRQIVEEAQKHGRPSAVLIEVGEIAGMEAVHLKEHMKELVDWKINVEEKKSSVKCRCGYLGRAKIAERFHDFVIAKCPACGSSDIEIKDGDKIILKSVKVK